MKTDKEEPKRPKPRSDSEDPTSKVSTTDKVKRLPKRENPMTDTEEPMRAN